MNEGQDWIYSDTVKDHFMNPRNFLFGDESQFDFDAVGIVGNPICGDQMKMYIKVKDGKIEDVRWKNLRLRLGHRLDLCTFGACKRQNPRRSHTNLRQRHRRLSWQSPKTQIPLFCSRPPGSRRRRQELSRTKIEPSRA